MKKRGLGTGLYNGAGGKPESGETIEQTATRECQEEVGITPLELTLVADLTFYLTTERGKLDMLVSAFICRKWEGEPTETEEMAPEWFPLDAIPYGSMWADDIHWLPLVLGGSFVTASFTFDAKDQVIDNQIIAHPLAGSLEF